MTSFSGRHAREISIVFVAQAGSALAAVATVKLLTSLLPPDQYGYAAVVTSYVVALTAVLAAPVTGAGATAYHDAVTHGRARELLGTLSVITVATLAIAATALVWHHQIESLDRARTFGGLVIFAVLYLAAELAKAPVLAIAAAARWRKTYGWLMLFDGWGKLALIGVAAGWISVSARNVIAATAINSALVAVIGWFVIFRFSPAPSEHRAFFSADVARATLRRGWFFAGIGVAGWMINLSDRVLLSALVPPHDVGIYVAGYQATAILPVGASALITGFVNPILLQKQATAPGEAAGLLGRVLVVMVWLLLPATFVTIAKRDLLLHVITSGRYAAAAPVVVWMAPALAFLAVTNVGTYAFWMSKSIRAYCVIALIAGLTNVAMNLFLVPRIGYIAAAISTFVTYAVQMSAVIIVGRRRVRWGVKKSEGVAIAAGTAALIAWLAAVQSSTLWLDVAAAVTAYGIVSIAVFLLLDAAALTSARAMLLRFNNRWARRSA